MVGNDSVIALGGVIGSVCKTGAAECGNLRLEDLDIWRISGCAAWTGSKRTRVDGLLLLRIVDHSFGPDAEECSQISLIEMDHT